MILIYKHTHVYKIIANKRLHNIMYLQCTYNIPEFMESLLGFHFSKINKINVKTTVT